MHLPFIIGKYSKKKAFYFIFWVKRSNLFAMLAYAAIDDSAILLWYQKKRKKRPHIPFCGEYQEF